MEKPGSFFTFPGKPIDNDSNQFYNAYWMEQGTLITGQCEKLHNPLLLFFEKFAFETLADENGWTHRTVNLGERGVVSPCPNGFPASTGTLPYHL